MNKPKAIASRVCASCPFRSGCPRMSNPKALGWCQEFGIYLLFVVLLTLEIRLAF